MFYYHPPMWRSLKRTISVTLRKSRRLIFVLLVPYFLDENGSLQIKGENIGKKSSEHVSTTSHTCIGAKQINFNDFDNISISRRWPNQCSNSDVFAIPPLLDHSPIGQFDVNWVHICHVHTPCRCSSTFVISGFGKPSGDCGGFFYLWFRRREILVGKF